MFAKKTSQTHSWWAISLAGTCDETFAELGPWQCKELDHIADVSATGLPWQHHVANRSSHMGEKCFNAMKVRNALIDTCFSFRGICNLHHAKKLSDVKATWTFYAKSFQNNHCHCHKFHKWVYQTDNVAFEDLHLALHMIIHLGHNKKRNAGNFADGFSAWSQAAMLVQTCNVFVQLHWVSNSELRLIFEVRIKNWPKTPRTAGTNVRFMGFLWGGWSLRNPKYIQ